MKLYSTVYYIGKGNIIGPLTVWSVDISHSLNGPFKTIIKASNFKEGYSGEEKDFVTEKELIGKDVYILGKIPAKIIRLLENDKVEVYHIHYHGETPFYGGSWIHELNQLSLKPDEKFLLTKEPDQGKIQEMNTETKNPFFELSEAFVKFTNSLAEKLENYNAANRKFSESLKNIREKFAAEDCNFSLTLKEAENFQNLHTAAAQPNKKILVLEHKRFLLNSALTLAPGTKIDILRADDSRVNDKNYDLVIS